MKALSEKQIGVLAKLYLGNIRINPAFGDKPGRVIDSLVRSDLARKNEVLSKRQLELVYEITPIGKIVLFGLKLSNEELLTALRNA